MSKANATKTSLKNDIVSLARELNTQVSSTASILSASRTKVRKSKSSAKNLSFDVRELENAIKDARLAAFTAEVSVPNGYDVAEECIKKAKAQLKEANSGDYDALISASYNLIDAVSNIRTASYAASQRDYDVLRELSRVSKQLAHDIDDYVDSTSRLSTDYKQSENIELKAGKIKAKIDALPR